MRTLTVTKHEYSRTRSGKSWKTHPDTVGFTTMPWDRRDAGDDPKMWGELLHKNMTNAETLSYFRRLGGSESAQRSYTPVGYIVTRLVSTSPDRQKRVVRTFTISDD